MDDTKKINGTDIVNRILFILKQKKMTRDELAQVIGKSKQVFTDWKSQNIVPKADDVYYISKHLGVSMDYLLFGEQIIPDEIAAMESMLIELPEEVRSLIFDMIKASYNAKIGQ